MCCLQILHAFARGGVGWGGLGSAGVGWGGLGWAGVGWGGLGWAGMGWGVSERSLHLHIDVRVETSGYVRDLLPCAGMLYYV